MAAPRILLVDSDHALLEALREVLPLRIPGAMVDTSASLSAALERIAETDYEVVALDSTMPGMSGLGLLAQVRALRPDTAIVLITGQTDSDLAAQALRGGAFDVLPKPLAWDAFSAAIDRAVGVRQTSRRREEPPRAPTPSTTPAKQPERATPGAARRVLIIEDDADGREMLRILLQAWGHQVEAAANGPQGIEQGLAGRFDVAVIDIGLPGLDGYQVAQQLRAAPAGRNLVLIALTGYGEPEDRRRALAAGFDAHLTKPVDPAQLAEKLRLP
jgi:CheY-like chemotaxis protein